MIFWKCFAHHYHALAMNTQINKFRDLFFKQIMFLFYVWVVAFEMAWVGCDFAWGLSVAFACCMLSCEIASRSLIGFQPGNYASCIYVCMYIYIYIYICVCVCVNMCVCVCVCVCIIVMLLSGVSYKCWYR